MAQDEELNEIKKLVKDKSFVVGTENTIKNLKKNKISKIWLSSNIPEMIKEDIMNYSSINNVEVVNLELSNEDFGVLLKKQFSVSVASVMKGEK